MRTLLYIFAVMLLSSCAGKNFLHQKYTHFRHAPCKADLPPVAVHETVKESERSATVREPERFVHIEKKRITVFNTGKADAVPKPLLLRTLTKTVSEKTKAATASVPQQKEKASKVSISGRPAMLKASASESEDEPQKMSYLTWFFTITLLVPMCLVLGIFFLFQPHWWIGLIILGLGALIFWGWLQSEPELFYRGP
jgi:lipopolysaccharide export LptBFGC system permease protein LptF